MYQDFRDFRKYLIDKHISFRDLSITKNIIILSLRYYPIVIFVSCHTGRYTIVISDCNSCYIFISQPPLFLKWKMEKKIMWR